jgi:hypothetical protein
VVQISRSHTYSFTLYGRPDLDDLIAELQKVKAAMPPDMEKKVTIHSVSDREGYSMTVKVEAVQ